MNERKKERKEERKKGKKSIPVRQSPVTDGNPVTE